MNILPPKSWEEFEEMTLDACKIRWQNPDLQRNGRQGQTQNGVDILGSNHLFDLVGVQCKNYKDKLNISLIKTEIIKAESFLPKLKMYYFACTDRTDSLLQKEVRVLSQERTSQNKFPVMILFWDDIVQDLVQDVPIFKKHYPQISISIDADLKVKDLNLYCILDLIYFTSNLDFYNQLIFGEIGALVSEDPLQIKSVLFSIKYSASKILQPTDYDKVAKLINEYIEYLFPKTNRNDDFLWSKANSISSEFVSIILGVQYQLAKRELAIYNVGKILSKWNIWESNSNEELWADDNWESLIKFIAIIELSEISNLVEGLRKQYEKGDHWIRLDFPHKVYNHIRLSLMYK
ncbi:hypothetical protein [Flavobacterium rhizosphaerae]|uniref:Restriction endonuclease n=1 Tax=Flavobacterium rhizosphaerae TaxID=3163298 RepID=A0ABW8YUT0_9FLAO